MKNLKLTMDLIPKGAWGSSLSKQLSKDDWDTLRQFAFSKARGECSICGCKTNELDAHEVWFFDKQNSTQTLKNIQALCTRCHGVKHFRNSERLGYGQNAKRHFLKVNCCSELDFANHCFESMLDFEEKNKIYRWKISVDFAKFGGSSEMEINEYYLPYITNPYQDVGFSKLNGGLVPILYSVIVDNYAGTIMIECGLTIRVELCCDKVLLKSFYNTAGRFVVKFSLKNCMSSYVQFRLIGEDGAFKSEKFELGKWK